jgi:hypothetical protein
MDTEEKLGTHQKALSINLNAEASNRCHNRVSE